MYLLLGVKSILAIAMVTQQSLPSVWFRLSTELTWVHAGGGGWWLVMTASEGGVEHKLQIVNASNDGEFSVASRSATVTVSRSRTPKLLPVNWLNWCGKQVRLPAASP